MKAALIAACALSAFGQTQFRPYNNQTTGIPPTIPQKGPAWFPGRVAFINQNGLLDGLTGTASNCIHIDGSSGACGGSGTILSVFGRTGAITANLGDYQFNQIGGQISPAQLPGLSLMPGALLPSQISQNGAAVGNVLAWNGSIWAPATGGSGGGGSGGAITSVFGRTGVVTAVSGDYSFSQISGTAGAGQIPNLQSLNGLLTMSQLDGTGFSDGQMPCWGGSAFGPCNGGGGGGGVVPLMSYAEVPSGTINGTNQVFTIINVPNPTASLGLYLNGLLMKVGFDYTLSGSSITFINGSGPVSGDLLQAWYQYGYSAALPPSCAANTVAAGPTTGSAQQPSCRALVVGDLPATAENTANKDTENGYAGLDSGGRLKVMEIPTLNQSTTGNAATATQLFTAGTQCGSGQAPQGVDASGNALNCQAVTAGIHAPLIDAADHSSTAVATQQTLSSLTIPANTMSPTVGSWVHISFADVYTETGDPLILKFGGTSVTILNTGTTTGTKAPVDCDVFVTGANAEKFKCLSGYGANIAYPYLDLSTGTEVLTSDVTVSVVVQTGGSAGVNTLKSFTVEWKN